MIPGKDEILTNKALIKPVAKWKYVKQLDSAIRNLTKKFYDKTELKEIDVQRVNTWFNKLKKHIEEGL